MPIVIPEKVPQAGFYYHYKHDAGGRVENYAYEVLGTGFHTDPNDGWPSEDHFVVYRPLYKEASVYKASTKLGAPCLDLRPLADWMDVIPKNGGYVRRFARITDPATIAILTEIRDEMYNK